MAARLVDANGMTVEVAVVNGVQQFIVRDSRGYLPLPLGVPMPILTSPADLERFGVDLASLR